MDSTGTWAPDLSKRRWQLQVPLWGHTACPVGDRACLGLCPALPKSLQPQTDSTVALPSTGKRHGDRQGPHPVQPLLPLTWPEVPPPGIPSTDLGGPQVPIPGAAGEGGGHRAGWRWRPVLPEGWDLELLPGVTLPWLGRGVAGWDTAGTKEACGPSITGGCKETQKGRGLT